MPPAFPDSQTLGLQREALRRVREMQQRAQQSVEQSNSQSADAQSSFSANAFTSPQNQFNPSPPPPRQSTGTAQHNTQRPNNILTQLFGGMNRQGGARGKSPPQRGGIMDILSRQGLGDSIGGLGETIQSTISSVSQPVADLLDGFGIDGEKLVIMLIMWAVFNEHQDNKTLLLALGYLLL